MDIMTWRPGDRAYISGEPKRGYLSKGDIVKVTRVTEGGEPCFGNGHWASHLDDLDRKPLRILKPGERVPKGAQYLRVWNHGDTELVESSGVTVQWNGALLAIVSLPEPEKSKAEQYVAEAKQKAQEAVEAAERAEQALGEV